MVLEVGWKVVDWIRLARGRGLCVVVNSVLTSECLKVRAISWLAEELVAFQDDRYLMELVKFNW